MSIKRGPIWKISLLLALTLVFGIGGTSLGFAQGGNDTRVYRTEYSWVGVVADCGPDRPGEQVAFTATWLVVLHSTVDANGGHHHLERSNLHGEGVGLTSGDRYVISAYGPEWIWLNHNHGPDSAETYTINGRIRITRVGAPGVWYTHILQRYIVNANGETTVDTATFNRGCQ